MRNPYSYCPCDGGNLIVQGGLATCPRCGFIDYMNPKPCVAVIVEREGSVLLGAKKVGTGHVWDILGGFIEHGETAEEAAIREVREEAHLELSNLQYFMSARDAYPPWDEPTLTLCFTAVSTNWPPKADSDVEMVQLFVPENIPSNLAFPHQKHLLESWRDKSRAHVNEITNTRLIEEYRQCQVGYQYRDQLTQDEFVKLFQIFSVLFLLLAGTAFLGKADEWLLLIIRVMLCATGTSALLALLIDLQANAGCKRSLRTLSSHIEVELGLKYWTVVASRKMGREERYAKKILGWLESKSRPTPNTITDGSITDMFVWIGRFLCAIWFIISLAAIIMGPAVAFR